MFGFLKRRLIREHAKLVCQNILALPYLEGYYGNKDVQLFKEDLQIILGVWRYGQELSHEQSTKMIEINRHYRRLYDATIGGYLKKFDDEFAPLQGWQSFFERVEI